ncbi:MAG: PBP1A family penicillin-binding protein [Firmicutes bacterium]|nr:PBP1A family penicillin-binding protein [Bacillota bacterium]
MSRKKRENKQQVFEPIPRERAMVLYDEENQALFAARVSSAAEEKGIARRDVALMGREAALAKTGGPLAKRPGPSKKEVRKRRRRVWLSVAAGFFVGAILFGVFVMDIPHWQSLNITKLTRLSQTSRMYDRNGALITTLQGRENRTVIRLSQVPEEVQNAFVAAEDLRFYNHHGFDLVRIFGSILANLRSRTYSEGASTITQQLVKLTHLSEAKTLARKGEELYLAIQLESRYTKREILEMYLNTVYFGEGAYGLQAAAELYFGKNAAELTVAEGAALAATIKAPSAYGLTTGPETNKTRRDYILHTMIDNGFLSAEAGEAAMGEEIALAAIKPRVLVHGWFVDAALKEAQDILGITADELLGGGYYIETTMDPGLQTIAENLFADAKNFPANAADGTLCQGAMAVADIHDGGMLALVGGREYKTMRGFNRATDMRRSPGSSIKPLAVYAPALEKGYTTASVLWDERRVFSGGYNPRNSGDHYYGAVTARRALALSMNVATVQLMQEIGVGTSTSFLRKAGVALTNTDANLSLALGSMTQGVTPAEMAASYAMFGNQGVYNPPYTVARVFAPDGGKVYEHKAASRTAMSPQNSYLITSMLQSVTNWGTGAKLSATGLNVAGKTGTNSLVGISGNRDAWMDAYTSDFALACWMGFDATDANHRLPSRVTGGDAPAAMATAFFRAAYRDRAKPSFKVPSGLVWLTIDTAATTANGSPMLAGSYTPSNYKLSEVFLESNRPWQTSSMWQTPRALSYFYIDYESSGHPKLVFGASDSANYRVERVKDGRSMVITELYGSAGQTLTYTDWTAVAGEWYTYRVTPVHAGMLDSGVLLEGPSSSQSVQAKWASSTVLDGVKKWLVGGF